MPDVEGEIILCFECGAKNRLKLGWSGAPVCGKCGEPLPVQARPNSRPSSNPRASASKMPLGLLAVVCIALLAVVGYVVVGATQSSHKNPEQNPFLAFAPSAEPATPPTTNKLSTDGIVPINVDHRIELLVLAQAWVEVTRSDGSRLVSDTLQPGEVVDLGKSRGTVLSTGNAGGIAFRIDGETHPPLGKNGQVRKGINIDNEVESLLFERDIQASTAPQPPQQPILTPVAVKPGVVLKNTKADFIAPFQIKTSPGANYYVKLVDVKTGRATVGIYVIGGQTLDVDVPLGRYEMRYASGQTWYGLKHLFGPKPATSYAKADDILDFAIQGNQISGYTVELIQQVNGNLDTRPIDESQF